MRKLLLALVALLLASPATLAQDGPRVALVTDSRGFVHDVVKPVDGDSLVVRTMREIVEGQLKGTLTHISDAATLDLASADVVAFYTTGPISLDVPAFQTFIENGGGLVGMHCATDTLKQDAAWVRLIGARFAGHPWNADDSVVLRSIDPDHPVARPIGGRRALREEIYIFNEFQPDQVRVVTMLDPHATPKKQTGSTPIAWVKQVGEGRVAYTSLGHRPDVWQAPWYQQHLAQLIGFAAGNVDASVEPNPTEQRRIEQAGKQERATRQRDDERDPPAATQPQSDATPERGRDPWVFRCVLDRRPRVVVVALSPDLWAAYDATTCNVYKVWRGDLELTGSVYDTRHGPQPQTRGDELVTFGENDAWSIGDGEPIQPRWMGYRVDGQRSVTMQYRLPTESDGAGVTVRETPEATGPRTLRRQFEVSGIVGEPVRLMVSVGQSRNALTVEAGDAAMMSESRGIGEVTLLEITRDGTYTVDITWPDVPANAKEATE